MLVIANLYVITLRPRQNNRNFANDFFKRIFLNDNVLISIKISLKFAPKGQINNIPALVSIMAWRRLGDKPLSVPRMESLLTHICVTRPQWVIHANTHNTHINQKCVCTENMIENTFLCCYCDLTEMLLIMFMVWYVSCYILYVQCILMHTGY